MYDTNISNHIKQQMMNASENDIAQVNAQMKDLPLHKFLLFGLQDLYWAEQHLVSSLPKLADAATSPDLKAVLNDHLRETKGHVTRLEQSFKMLNEKQKDTKCKAMSGILKEAEDMIDETEKGSAVRDVAVIMAAQKIEHYEITSYGSVIVFAELMNHTEVANLLHATLDEEKKANFTLTDLAKRGINAKALNER